MLKQFQGFITFVREHGVIGLAIGFMLGVAIQKVVSAFVNDLVYPLVSLLLPGTADLRTASVSVNGSEFLWGDFVATTIDFVIIAVVIYFGFRALRLDRIDQAKK